IKECQGNKVEQKVLYVPQIGLTGIILSELGWRGLGRPRFGCAAAADLCGCDPFGEDRSSNWPPNQKRVLCVEPLVQQFLIAAKMTQPAGHQEREQRGRHSVCPNQSGGLRRRPPVVLSHEERLPPGQRWLRCFLSAAPSNPPNPSHYQRD